MGANQPDTVYLVEDHTRADPTSQPVYWAHVYLSRSTAQVGVEHFAQRGGHGPVQWTEHAPVLYAHSVRDAAAAELYRIVPLQVRGDDQSQP